MKKIIALCILNFLFSLVFAQHKYKGYLGFDTTTYWGDSNIQIIIDTNNNVWKIGEPNGSYFNGGYNYPVSDIRHINNPKAIFTDKSNMNQDTGTYSFYIMFTAERKGEKKIRDYGYINTFMYAFSTKTDLGINEKCEVYLSNDQGETWHPYPHLTFTNKNDWKNIAALLAINNKIGPSPYWLFDFDTLITKIVFTGDKNANTEGIMFDNFRFTIECGFSINIIESNNRCLINIVSNSNTYNIPVTNCNSLNKYILYNIQGYQIKDEVFNINSRNIDIRNENLVPGIYLLVLTYKNSTEIKTYKVLLK
jgi:hypothetical protein